MVVTGDPIGAAEALKNGLIEEIVEGPDSGAEAFVRKAIAEKRPLRKLRDDDSKLAAARADRKIFTDAAAAANKRNRGMDAPLACAEAVGGIRRTVEMSVQYVKTRHQFGKPIGSFQAVKHRCADMAVRAEVARSATIYAVISVRDGTPDQDFQLDVAKLLCANAYIQNAADNVQNHGGMGFTWECDAHLFVKRARSFDLAFGSRQRHLDSLVAGFRAARPSHA